MAEHYFSAQPQSPQRLQVVGMSARGVHADFLTSSGVFSKSRLDPGSALLIEAAQIQPSWLVLDMGCGYGPVGILLAKAFPRTRFILSDVNERAVALARMNIKRNSVSNGEARVSDGFAFLPDEFDAVLLNPPQTAGKKVCLRLFKESFDHLKPGGLLQVVARHNKGGSTLSSEMKKIFGNVQTIARKGGYHVYVSEK